MVAEKKKLRVVFKKSITEVSRASLSSPTLAFYPGSSKKQRGMCIRSTAEMIANHAPGVFEEVYRTAGFVLLKTELPIQEAIKALRAHFEVELVGEQYRSWLQREIKPKTGGNDEKEVDSDGCEH